MFRRILAVALVLGLTGYVCAQDNSVGISDLPDCAAPCAKNAAALVSCSLTDVTCLCSHDQFTSSTVSCANTPGVCGIEDRSSVSGILGAMCAQNASTTSSSAPASSATTSTSTSAKPSETSTSTTASPAATTSTTHTETDTTKPTSTTTQATTPVAAGAGTTNTNTIGGGLTPAPTTSGSSTLVVVQTVVLPQTSDLTGGALKVDGGVGLYAVWPLILAMAGGLLL